MLYFISVLIFTVVRPSISDNLSQIKKSPSSAANDWDYLVYSQRWPITSCVEWENKSPHNVCTLPQDNSTWIVHGVWPSRFNSDGPYFCNSALHFDPDQLDPMMKELQEFWTNIESNTKANSFWKHEWIKHGTCASSLPQLNSVTNFFRQGLDWNREYQLSNILIKNNVIPNALGYNISDVFDGIKQTLGKNPEIECIVDGKTKQYLISEIRLCFNKTLDLIDCNVSTNDERFQKDKLLINCNPDKNVMYLATVPTNNETEILKDVYYDYDEPHLVECLEYFNLQGQLLKVYSIIKFVMWFTL